MFISCLGSDLDLWLLLNGELSDLLKEDILSPPCKTKSFPCLSGFLTDEGSLGLFQSVSGASSVWLLVHMKTYHS